MVYKTIFVFVFFILSISHAQEPDFPKTLSGDIVRVVDGDTVIIEYQGRELSCRLIGVDTPETVHPSKPVEAYGKEASAFLTNLLKGESVWIEQEPSNKTDRYGRQLVYIYRQPDGLFINQEIVRQGYGHVYTAVPFKYMEQFKKYQTKAMEVGKGLWSIPETSSQIDDSKDEATQSGSVSSSSIDAQAIKSYVYITDTGTKYHTENCRFLKSKTKLTESQAQSKGYEACKVCKP